MALATVLAVTSFSPGTFASAADEKQMVIERTVSLMGTYASVSATAGTRAAALTASERALRALETAERRLSTWSTSSELARVNHSRPGETVKISPLLKTELEGALSCHRETGGAFNPALGALVKLWGLRMGGMERSPAPGAIANALTATNPHTFELSPRGITRRAAGTAWEEGGFGKGAALDDVARGAAGARLIVNLGGQLLVTEGPPVVVRLDHAALDLLIERGSLSTSGNDKRSVKVAGNGAGHILDPTTGQPARDFGSLTILATSGLRADCLSTGLYVMGPRRALKWLLENPVAEGLLVTKGARIATCGLKKRLLIKNAKTDSVKFICNQQQLERLIMEYEI